MPEIDLTEKIADWKPCEKCDKEGCAECSYLGYILVDR